MNIGVSSACLYPQYLEEALDRLEASGFTDFEIFFNAYSELDPKYLASIRKDRKIISVHPFFYFSISYCGIGKYHPQIRLSYTVDSRHLSPSGQ